MSNLTESTLNNEITMDKSFKDNDEDDLFQSAISSLHVTKDEENKNASSDTKHEEIVASVEPPNHEIPLNGNSEMADDEDESEPIEESIHNTNEKITINNATEPSTPTLKTVTPVEQSMDDKNNEQYIKIRLTDAVKVGEGMSSYVTYRIETVTNLGLFRKKSLIVNRRFSDFLGLHEKLVEKYLRSGRIIPPAPQKNALGTTRVKISGSSQAESNSSSTDFVERRKIALERYLLRTAAHHVLRVDPDFREFLETDGDLPKATNTSALSSASVKRLFNKVGVTVNKIAYKMDETEPWFEEKLVLIDSIMNQLRKLHGAIELLVLNRKDLAGATSAFAKSAAVLGNCEEHTGLSRALSQLAEVEEKVEAVQVEQSSLDFSILSELIKDYIFLFGAVKDIFHERVKVYQNWQHAEMTLTKKREIKAKMEYTGQTDKVKSAAGEVSEWEAKVERCEDEFNTISKVIKLEYDIFEKHRISEFKTVIISYLESLIKHQEQLMKHWETFLPEAKEVA